MMMEWIGGSACTGTGGQLISGVSPLVHPHFHHDLLNDNHDHHHNDHDDHHGAREKHLLEALRIKAILLPPTPIYYRFLKVFFGQKNDLPDLILQFLY